MTNFKFKLFAILILPISLHAAIADYNKQLLDASESGYLEQVKEALANGADIDIRDEVERTPLLHAVMNNHTEIASFLIKANADINAQDYANETPLYFAARNGNSYIVNELIKDRVNLNISGTGIWVGTPLHLAINKGHIDVIQALLKARADINFQDKHQDTPLHTAVLEDNLEVLNMLILAGASIDTKNESGWTPLFNAASHGRIEVIKALLDVGADSTYKIENGVFETIFEVIGEFCTVKNLGPVLVQFKDPIIKTINDHQIYQKTMLEQTPKLFADLRESLNIPDPIAKLITQYAFGKVVSQE